MTKRLRRSHVSYAKSVNMSLCVGLMITILTLLLPTTAAQEASTKNLCRTQSKDKSKRATFLCSYQVTIRQDNCSANITERITFPHTTGAKELRDIKVLEKVQKVSAVTLEQGNSTAEVKTKDEQGGQVVRIEMSTEKSGDPVVLILNYTMSNFVMKAQNPFGDSSKQLRYNIMRWRSSTADRKIDKFSISFIAPPDQNKTMIMIEGLETAASRNATTSQDNVTKNLEVFASEKGHPICQQPLRFFEDGSTLWSSILIPLGCIFALIVYVVCIGGSCGDRRGDVAPVAARGTRGDERGTSSADGNAVDGGGRHVGAVDHGDEGHAEKVAFQQTV